MLQLSLVSPQSHLKSLRRFKIYQTALKISHLTVLNRIDICNYLVDEKDQYKFFKVLLKVSMLANPLGIVLLLVMNMLLLEQISVIVYVFMSCCITIQVGTAGWIFRATIGEHFEGVYISNVSKNFQKIKKIENFNFLGESQCQNHNGLFHYPLNLRCPQVCVLPMVH